MKRKIGWLLVTWVVLSLLITSCGQAGPTATAPATPTAKATATAAAPTAPVEEKKVAAPVVQKPKYGGLLNYVLTADLQYFEDKMGQHHLVHTMHFTNNVLVSGDWAKGPAGGYGSNETDWANLYDVWGHKIGYVAESWQITEPGTVVFKIRQGLRYAINPKSEAATLVNSRELTADDVVFSLKLSFHDPASYYATSVRQLRQTQITAPDKWTVVYKFPQEIAEEAISRAFDNVQIVPPEPFEKWGSKVMLDWKNSVGTGAFILTDYVKGSSVTLQRNPNYWMKDPIGPGKGNQLPYLDTVKMLVITDASTRLAAMRTGKLDWLARLTLEDATSLKKQVPKLISAKFDSISQTPGAWRVDRAPFSDIRVRRALMMATDFESIKKNLFGGEAQILTFPIPYAKEYAAAYLGLDDPEMPASVKELYVYNPEKAKALLKEAGYPNGFKTNIVLSNTAEETDYYSIIKDMWAKVGVDLELRPTETGAKTAMQRGHTHDQMITAASTSAPLLYRQRSYRGDATAHGSMVNDSIANEAGDRMQIAVGTGNFAEANRIHKELMKYVLDQAWALPQVVPPTYTFWWPWLKNFSGEYDVGYQNKNWAQWVWIDEELKKSMGY